MRSIQFLWMEAYLWMKFAALAHTKNVRISNKSTFEIMDSRVYPECSRRIQATVELTSIPAEIYFSLHNNTSAAAKREEGMKKICIKVLNSICFDEYEKFGAKAQWH